MGYDSDCALTEMKGPPLACIEVFESPGLEIPWTGTRLGKGDHSKMKLGQRLKPHVTMVMSQDLSGAAWVMHSTA